MLTDAFYGEKRFRPIFNRIEELNDVQEKHRQDSYQKCIREMEQLERQFCEYAKKKKELEQKISLNKTEGVEKKDTLEDIETLKYKQNRMKVEYDNLEEKAFDFSMGMERNRFVELNDLEKELFGILLNEIRQADLWKMRYNKWEEFPLDMRNRIVELLDRLCDEEQWKAVGTGMELNIELIKYKLLYPREYRLIKVAEMLVSDVILQEMKDNVLEKMDKSIFSAYKQLLKVDVMDNIERLAEEGFEDAVERLLKKNKK